MSVTEQIARKTRKSTVLDEKNALLIMAIPDYDEYKVLQPYSCRSITNRSKFVGGRDFITRHNPQEVNDFKKQFSREVGNLSRQRSVVAPPGSALATAGLLAGTSCSSLSTDSQPSPAANRVYSSSSNNNDGQVWKRVFTANHKTCWVLTDLGVETFIGPEYRITTRLPVLPPPSSPPRAATPSLCRRPPSRLDSPFVSAFNGCESARIGIFVDLRDEKTLAGLSRTEAYGLSSRPPTSPLRLTSRIGPGSSEATHERPSRSGPLYVDLVDQSLSPTLSPPSQPTPRRLRSPMATEGASPTPSDASPTTRPFAMEVSPPVVSLGDLRTGEVYLFPVRVRNVGFRQERFRVKQVSATSAGFDAALADASFDKDTARLAPGLAGIVTLALSFHVPGRAVGRLLLETQDAGDCEVPIKAVVR